MDEEVEEEEEAAYGEVKAERPVAGLALGAAGLDLSGNGGCGGWDGAAGVKADDGEGMVATLGASGVEEAVTVLLPPPPNGRAVLL